MSMERIVAVAVRHRGVIITKPAPARHGDVLKPLHKMDGRLVPPAYQGFLTSSGRFVTRERAARIAIAAGQIAALRWPPNLFSEDLW